MKQNMGTADRLIRTIIAAAIGFLLLSGALTGTIAIVLGIFAIIFLATSVVSFCPLYAPFKISTRKKTIE